MKNSQNFCLLNLFSVLFFSYTSLFANDIKHVTLNVKNVSLEIALTELAKQSDVHFVYASTAVKSILVSCDFSETPLNIVLHSLLKNTKLTYKHVRNKQIVIYKKMAAGKDVFGSIIDAGSGESLPYAYISISNSPNSSNTNSEGRFLLKNVRSWPCTLNVQYIGYLSGRVVLASDQPRRNIKIALRQSAVLLKEITVRSRKWEAFKIGKSPGQLSISPSHFSDLPIIGDVDISRSLQLMPGIQTSNYGGSGVYIRAGRPSENLVLLDGMTLYHMNHSFGFLSSLNPAAMKDVRVYKSGFPAKYGGRLSGIMELTTKSGDFSRPRVSVGASLLNTRAVVEIPFAGHGALLFSGRRTVSEHLLGPLHDRVFSTILNDITPFHFDDSVRFLEPTTSKNVYFYDGFGKLTYTPSQNDILTFSYYLGKDDIDNQDDYGDFYRLVNDSTIVRENDIVKQHTGWGTNGVSGRWYRQWRNFQTTVQWAYSDYFTRFNHTENFLFPSPTGDSSTVYVQGETKLDNDVKDHTFRLDVKKEVSNSQVLEFGLNYTQSAISLKRSGYQYLDDSLVPETYTINESADLVSLYSQDTWRLFDRADLEIGIRANYYRPSNISNAEGGVDWEPRISADYRLPYNLLFKGSWGKFHQYIMQFGDDFQYVDGNISWILADRNTLQPGSAEQLSTGLQFEQNGFMFDIEFYNKKLFGIFEPLNDRQFVSRNTAFTPLTQLKRTVYGIDTHLRQNINRFTGWLSYGYSRARTLRGSVTYPANQDTPHDLKLVGSIGLGEWNLATTWQLVSGKPYSIPDVEKEFDSVSELNTYFLLEPQNLNTHRLPFNHHLDLSITRRFSRSLLSGKVGASVYNLYNRKNIWYRYFIIQSGHLKPMDVHTFGITPSMFLELNF